MFERRLKILLILMAVPMAAMVLRLVQLQVVRAGYYESAGRRMLKRPVRYFPCLRGEIQDHEGRRLAFDAPAWDIGVRYEAITGNLRALKGLAREQSLSPGGIEAVLQASWQAISDLTGVSPAELRARQEEIHRSVAQMKEYISNLQGIEVILEEEHMPHAIVRGLDQNQQAAARVALAAYPWVEVAGGHRRQYAGGESFGHLLGYLNEVDPAYIRKDPDAENKLARYQMGDLRGVAGIERLAECHLRGLRGRQEEDIEGRLLSSVDPVNGRNFRMTLDLSLQQLIYNKLRAAVAANPPSTGASAVVLDVPSREILALVSYPGFDPNISLADRRRLDADAQNRPTRFRAVAERYPPGSIVKPIILAGAWSDRKAGPQTHVFCEGRLNASPPHFKCTASHGDVGPVFAIQHSCNIFFYRLGEVVRVPRLSDWLSQAGLGRPTGIGLVEEVAGALPGNGNIGQARYTAIGQWDVQATPLQAANMVATLAAGAWRPVTIWADDPQSRKAVPLPVAPEALQAVREGMYRVVNEPGGTAYEHVHLENMGDLVLLGKTGSAETQLGAIVERIYVCRFPDGSEEELLAGNDTDLVLKYPKTRNARIVERRPFRYYPTAEMDPTHAWFAGYLTSRDRYLESSAGGRLNVALAVLIEYGGHGGGAAAPVAGEIVQAIINMQGRAKDEGQGDKKARGQRAAGFSPRGADTLVNLPPPTSTRAAATHPETGQAEPGGPP